jgi:hypothetical protein
MVTYPSPSLTSYVAELNCTVGAAWAKGNNKASHNSKYAFLSIKKSSNYEINL